MRKTLRARLARKHDPLLLPGAANALAARVIEELGFEAVYVTGAGIANSYLGAPDIGLLSLDELVAHVEAITDAVQIPVVVDADTGFGNALNAQRSMRRLERAGASAIQIEDQTFPKRCGHFESKSVITPQEAAAKVAAIAEAREDENLLIIARTDAAATEGLQAALDRAALFVEAGAEVIFVEAISSPEQVREMPRLLKGVPLLINMVEGGKTPLMALEELSDYAIVLYANAALQGAIFGMRNVLKSLRETGNLQGSEAILAPWAERQELVRKDLYDAVAARFDTTGGRGT